MTVSPVWLTSAPSLTPSVNIITFCCGSETFDDAVGLLVAPVTSCPRKPGHTDKRIATPPVTLCRASCDLFIQKMLFIESPQIPPHASVFLQYIGFLSLESNMLLFFLFVVFVQF